MRISPLGRIWDPSCVCVSYYITKVKLRGKFLLWFMKGVQSIRVEKHDAGGSPADEQLESSEQTGSGTWL